MPINTNTLNQQWWFLFWGWAGRTHRGVLLLIPAQDEAVLPLHLLHPVFTDLLEYITSQHVGLTNIYLSNRAQKNIWPLATRHSVIKLRAVKDIPNQTLFKNLIIVFKEQFASSEFYGRQRGLMERNRGNKKPHKLMAGVCSGLIMGSVDHIQHRTKALISAMSHLFFFLVFMFQCVHSLPSGSRLVELNGYLSCERRRPKTISEAALLL